MSGLVSKTFGVLVGLVFILFGGYVLVSIVGEEPTPGDGRVWIIGAAVIGVIGGVFYLLSFQGGRRLGRRLVRGLGWFGMLALVVVPTSFTIHLVVLLALAGATLLGPYDSTASSSAEASMSRSSRMVSVLARVVGLMFTVLGGWLFFINVIELSYAGTVLVWILAAGIAGAIGGALFLLSIDGPPRFRNRGARIVGWAGMLVLATLPTSVTLPLLVAIALTIPTLFGPYQDTPAHSRTQGS